MPQFLKWQHHVTGTLETTDPPLIDTICNRDTEVNGRGIPNALVNVFFPTGNNSVTVGINGVWSCTAVGNLFTGMFIEASQVEQGKAESTRTGTTVQDCTPMDSATPTIGIIREGDTSVSGTGVPNAEITFKDHTDTENQTNVNASGVWSIDGFASDFFIEGDTEFARQTESQKLPSAWVDTTVQAPVLEKAPTPSIPIGRLCYTGTDAASETVSPTVSYNLNWPEAMGFKARCYMKSPSGQTEYFNVDANAQLKSVKFASYFGEFPPGSEFEIWQVADGYEESDHAFYPVGTPHDMSSFDIASFTSDPADNNYQVSWDASYTDQWPGGLTMYIDRYSVDGNSTGGPAWCRTSHVIPEGESSYTFTSWLGCQINTQVTYVRITVSGGTMCPGVWKKFYPA